MDETHHVPLGEATKGKGLSLTKFVVMIVAVTPQITSTSLASLASINERPHQVLQTSG